MNPGRNSRQCRIRRQYGNVPPGCKYCSDNTGSRDSWSYCDMWAGIHLASTADLLCILGLMYIMHSRHHHYKWYQLDIGCPHCSTELLRIQGAGFRCDQAHMNICQCGSRQRSRRFDHKNSIASMDRCNSSQCKTLCLGNHCCRSIQRFGTQCVGHL